jgi:sugar lactone lactonase YvrE
MTVDLDGKAETVIEVPGVPSGLGWLPDGRLLIVSMTERKLLCLNGEKFVEVADLNELASGHCNDMVVDSRGRAYIGHFGYNMFAGEDFAPASVIMTTPDGKARIVAKDMHFPNGSVITPDGGTLIVAESFAKRLTAFDIEPDGSLSGRRVWAQLDEKEIPDGICLDAEGAVWVSVMSGNEVKRVREGGEATESVQVSTRAVACMLGGPGRRTLFVMTAESSQPDVAMTKRTGRVEIVEVDVPGAGFP